MRLGHIPVAFARLVVILEDVLLLQLSHPLDLIKVNDKALIFTVLQFDAFAAEDSRVHRAVEVLHTLGVLFTKLLLQHLFVFILKVESCLRKHGVFFNDFVENVDVEGKAFC